MFPSAIYVTKPEYLDELTHELQEVSQIKGNLVFSSKHKQDICFALDVFLNPVIIDFESISAAAKILRQAGKFWYLNPIENIRRSRLIESELRKLPSLKHEFPITTPLIDIGCFSLLDKNTLIYSTNRWKKPPLGDFQFIEDKHNPPNRAYLKLWEALALLGRYPVAGETAIDLGASPGGWSYVMQSFGTKVTAVDKAPLDPKIARLPNISFLKQSAFALDPNSLAHTIDWLLCDVACYPERLYDLTLNWIAANKAKQMIFTIKLQGETNLEIINKFQSIPGARVIHLFQNKHEATFFYPATPNLFPQFPFDAESKTS
ncbi:MAG: SAM-dependent methyltransferase [Gammaproteobacteria bacterium]